MYLENCILKYTLNTKVFDDKTSNRNISKKEYEHVDRNTLEIMTLHNQRADRCEKKVVTLPPGSKGPHQVGR